MQQTVPVTVAAAEMAATERGFRAVIELIIAAAMIGAKRARGEIFVSAMIAKARRQLPGILPIDAKYCVALGGASAHNPARVDVRRQNP